MKLPMGAHSSIGGPPACGPGAPGAPPPVLSSALAQSATYATYTVGTVGWAAQPQARPSPDVRLTFAVLTLRNFEAGRRPRVPVTATQAQAAAGHPTPATRHTLHTQ
jgi:hypothetical protein